MEKMFSSMIAGFTKDMSEEDKKKMKACAEQMVSMCPCMTGKEMSGEEKKAMAERMTMCCGNAKKMMSSFFKKTGSQSDEAEKSEKA